MANVTHVSEGVIDPNAPPPSVGAHHTNTATGKRWIASGIASVADWGRPLPMPQKIVEDTAFGLTLDRDVASVLWRVDSYGDRVISFPAVTQQGYFEVDVIIENNNGAERYINVEMSDAAGGVVDVRGFSAAAQCATYVRFGCWKGKYGTPAYWSIVERTLYGAATDIPGNYQYYGDTDIVPSRKIYLEDVFARTVWQMTFAMDRTLVLTKLYDAFPRDYYTKVELVAVNRSAGNIVITIDTVDGLPLVDNATLTIPANTTQVLTLAYYVGNAQFRWTLVSTHNL